MDSEAAVSVTATLSRRITFASHQNSVPLIRDLVLHNASEHDFEDLALELTSDREEVMNEILAYNKEDLEATWVVMKWLRSRNT